MYANVLRDLLGIVGISWATLVGQSFGGGVAMQLSYQNPDLCERLVLVDSGGLRREVSWLLRFITLPGSAYLMLVIFPSFVRAAPPGSTGSLVPGIRIPASLRCGGPPPCLPAVLTARLHPDHPFRHRSGGQTVSAMDRLYLTQECHDDRPGRPHSMIQ